MSDIKQELNDNDQEIKELTSQVESLDITNDPSEEKKQRMEEALGIINSDQNDEEKMRLITELYEKKVSQLKAEIKEQKSDADERKERLMDELKAINERVDQKQNSYEDTYSKLEESRKVLKGIQANIQALEKRNEEDMLELAICSTSRRTLSEQCNRQLKKVRDDTEEVLSTNSDEIMSLRAALKFTEVSIHILEGELEKELIDNYLLLDTFENLFLTVSNVDRSQL